MALPPFLKRKDSPATPPRPVAEGAGLAIDTEQARTRARRRLIGAAVLLVVGVVAFPLLFETQPRPIPVDIPVQSPRQELAASASADTKPAKPAKPRPPPIDPNSQLVAEAPPAAASVIAPVPALAPAPAVSPRPPAPLPTPQPTPQPARASAPLAPKPETPAPKPAPGASAAEAKTGRFVVQVGAFADATSAREARLKVERLGLKTYTQLIDSENGQRTRVRVGPFESREEAAKVLARIKAANLPGAVLNL